MERIFVNTEINDNSDISELMACFLKKEVNNPKFPIFSKRMAFLKHEEGGLNAVCEVMERYEKIAAEKAANQANIKAIKSMIQTFNATKQQIIQLYTQDEYNQAIKELQQEQSSFL